MNLIIVESPAKCLKIKHFLESSFPNKKFNVISTGGHIEEIKTPGLNIDLENNFEAKYVFKNNKFVKSLLLNSKKAENIYIATDLDYSGSFIGYSVCKLLNIDINLQMEEYGDSEIEDPFAKKYANYTLITEDDTDEDILRKTQETKKNSTSNQ